MARTRPVVLLVALVGIAGGCDDHQEFTIQNPCAHRVLAAAYFSDKAADDVVVAPIEAGQSRTWGDTASPLDWSPDFYLVVQVPGQRRKTFPIEGEGDVIEIEIPRSICTSG